LVSPLLVEIPLVAHGDRRLRMQGVHRLSNKKSKRGIAFVF